MHSKRIKLFSATLGGGALLAMGAIGVTATEVSSAQEPGPVQVEVPEITTGETSTETTAPESPQTTVATPPITTPPSTIPTGEPQ